MLSLARSNVTVSFSVSPLRETVSVALSPAGVPAHALRSASPEETAVLSMAVMMSPAFRPVLGAAAAVDGVDIRAFRHVVVLRGAVRNGLQRDAELSAVGHGAVFHEVVCDGHGVIDRMAKPRPSTPEELYFAVTMPMT